MLFTVKITSTIDADLPMQGINKTKTIIVPAHTSETDCLQKIRACYTADQLTQINITITHIEYDLDVLPPNYGTLVSLFHTLEVKKLSRAYDAKKGDILLNCTTEMLTGLLTGLNHGHIKPMYEAVFFSTCHWLLRLTA